MVRKMEEKLPWRPEFVAALRLLARVSEAMAARGLPRPVLVGGGAVEFYTGSALMTGDIDVTSPVQPELEEELVRAGFERPSGQGASLRHWVYRDLGFGFEIVGSAPMGGTVDASRIGLVEPAGGTGRFRVLAIEDMIADRMAQFGSGSAPDMLDQAQKLFALYPNVDRTYLDRRIREETAGDYGVEDINR